MASPVRRVGPEEGVPRRALSPGQHLNPKPVGEQDPALVVGALRPQAPDGVFHGLEGLRLRKPAPGKTVHVREAGAQATLR